MAVKAVTALVNNSLNNSCHVAHKWADYYPLYSLPSYQTQDPDGSEKDLALKMEKKLGYRFKYPRLLRSAFTHPSYPSAWARVPCYQRLEFLGDSLLDLVCVEDLYQRFPTRDPQWLTEHKVSFSKMKFRFFFVSVSHVPCLTNPVTRWLWCPISFWEHWLCSSGYTLIYSISAMHFSSRLTNTSRSVSWLPKIRKPRTFG